jgi:hypothetical protein
LLTAVLLACSARAAGCPIPGEPLHWIADYCMARNQSDDEIVATPCIEEERKRRFASACEAKRHYKRQLCRNAIRYETRRDSVEACLADRQFVGPTVRGGGVGGR